MKTFKTITIIIVIGIIIFLLIGFHQIFFRPHIHDGYDSRIAKMSVIEAAIDTYKQHTRQYPNKLEDLINCPIGLESTWKGPYLKEQQMYDPWDRPFIYEPNNSNHDGYDFICYGADGKPGGEGYNADIYNK